MSLAKLIPVKHYKRLPMRMVYLFTPKFYYIDALPVSLWIQGEGLFIVRNLGRIVIYFHGFVEKA